MKHWWEEPTWAGRFVVQLFILRTPQRSACQIGVLQHNRPSLTVLYVVKSVYITGNDSPSGHYTQHIPHYRASSPSNLSHSALGKSHCSKHLSKTSLPHVCVSLVSFWIANDKWCSKEKSHQRTWQWRALKKKGNNSTLDWSFWRSHRQLLLKHKAALFYSEGFGWAWRVWADLKNNEVDVLFYRLNNEVVCFREQPPTPHPSLSQRHHPPSSPPLWWSWYMHKQHFHGVPSIAGLEAWCPIYV